MILLVNCPGNDFNGIVYGYCVNVFSGEGVKFGKGLGQTLRFETVKADLYVSQALQV